MKVFILFSFVMVFVFSGLYDYLSLPVVGIDQDGQCKYLITHGVKQDCGDLPEKYIREYVK